MLVEIKHEPIAVKVSELKASQTFRHGAVDYAVALGEGGQLFAFHLGNQSLSPLDTWPGGEPVVLTKVTAVVEVGLV